MHNFSWPKMRYHRHRRLTTEPAATCLCIISVNTHKLTATWSKFRPYTLAIYVSGDAYRFAAKSVSIHSVMSIHGDVLICAVTLLPEMARYRFGFYVRLHSKWNQIAVVQWIFRSVHVFARFPVGHIGIDCEMCIRC